MAGERTPSHTPYLRRPWTRGRIGGRSAKGALILVLAFLAYFLLLGESGGFRQLRLQARKGHLAHEVELLERQEKLLEAESERLESDPAYRKRILREEWGYMEPGEQIYHIRRSE